MTLWKLELAAVDGVTLLGLIEELFDTASDTVFFVKDREARYRGVSQTLVERCGRRTKEELLGRTVLEVFPKAMGRSYLEQDRQVMDSGLPLRNELELHLYQRGQPGWCLTNKVPLRQPDGSVIGLVGISRDLHVPADQPSGYQELASAVRHVQKHYHTPLRIEDLARLSALSTYQFEQRMKRVFQLTAGQFITKTRIEAACDLLRKSNKSIAEVAVDCGFYDQSAFSRQFKATAGLTPGAYRARLPRAPNARLEP